MNVIECDFLVIGSGLAGLTAARRLAPHGRVVVVTKRTVEESNTNYAQGGVSCVTLPEDSFDRHVADTLDAGAGLCHEDVVRAIVEDGPARMDDLRAAGLVFDTKPDGTPDLGREGGHTMRRVLHAGDITGREIERTEAGETVRSFYDPFGRVFARRRSGGFGSGAYDRLEAVYMRDKRFVWAVQWHPEYLYKKDHDASAIFEAFISSCSASKTQF